MKNNVGIFISYNDKNLISYTSERLEYSLNQSVGRVVNRRTYTYNSDGSLKSSEYSGNASVNSSFTYDAFDRLSAVSNNHGSFTSSISYTYRNADANTGAQVASYAEAFNGNTASFNYTYDVNGNITKVVRNNGTENRYVYDNLGQLLREDNGENQRTYLYTYDDAGNMTSKVDYPYTAAGVTPSGVIASYSYGYSTGTWGDMLTSYNGNSITYDSIGNPLSYYNGASYTFGWTGRQLTSATRGSVSMTFKYNDEGMRTSKTVGSVVTKYYYNGDRLLAEEMGGRLITYIYDANGSLIGMTHRLASYAEDVFDVYWYQKNLQGDVIAVYDNSGTKLVTYTYDAWGRHSTSYFNNGANTPASYNRIRYRGYYYDTDLYLYYLGSRYYDSNTCRFINADDSLYHSMLGYNMFAYCKNNPIRYIDPTGQSAVGAIAFLTGVAIAEPTPIGEVILIVVIATVGTAVIVDKGIEVVETITEIVESSSDDSDDAPKSVEGTVAEDSEESNLPSRPGKMQKEVERGQAPKEVESVHNAHDSKTGKPHVHFGDGTAMNNDGTPHDDHKGVPRPSRKTKKWLEKHNWSSSMKILP